MYSLPSMIAINGLIVAINVVWDHWSITSHLQIAIIKSDNVEHQLMLFRFFSRCNKKFFSFTLTLFVHTNETESGM